MKYVETGSRATSGSTPRLCVASRSMCPALIVITRICVPQNRRSSRRNWPTHARTWRPTASVRMPVSGAAPRARVADSSDIVDLEPALAYAEHHRLRPRGYADLVEDVAHVRVNGPNAHLQLTSDQLVTRTPGRQPQHFLLALAQRSRGGLLRRSAIPGQPVRVGNCDRSDGCSCG